MKRRNKNNLPLTVIQGKGAGQVKIGVTPPFCATNTNTHTHTCSGQLLNQRDSLQSHTPRSHTFSEVTQDEYVGHTRYTQTPTQSTCNSDNGGWTGTTGTGGKIPGNLEPLGLDNITHNNNCDLPTAETPEGGRHVSPEGHRDWKQRADEERGTAREGRVR